MLFAKPVTGSLVSIFLLVLPKPAITGADQVDPLLSLINQQLVNGQVVVIYQMENIDKTSEQYADWAYYLNDFAIEHSASYQFHPANQAVNEKIGNNQIDTTDSYTLFLKEGDVSYFYPGVIVEAMVYFAVDQAYAGSTSNDVRDFLPSEVTVEFGPPAGTR